MADIPARDLRNDVSEVLRRVERGERLRVTVSGRPVAELIPIRRRRVVPVDEALHLVSRHAADFGLLAELNELLPDTTDEA